MIVCLDQHRVAPVKTIRRFCRDRDCRDGNFFATGAGWGFKGTNLEVKSGSNDRQGKFKMVVGVVEGGVMRNGFRLVGGQVMVVW